ncbi:MAG TPA: type II toxin-antitoxin system Phd/YefM family antitoxin [Acetobacteraceae bacterium]|nr:type II toxin-antitoxin system Phd/YefM family antitoxin [Acetobacteraceae bacterium]
MGVYSVADAKNALPALIDRALQGEAVVITRRGKPVVELRPALASGRSVPSIATHAWFRARRRGRKGVGLTSVEILNQLYDTDDH